MGSFFGYIGSLIGVSLWVLTLLGVVIMVIVGLIHYTKKQTVEDPGEADPEVLSGGAPPLGKGEMSRFEAVAVKPSLPMLIFALAMLVTVVGFGAYGLKEMAAGTKTTAMMRKEAKDQAKATKDKYGTPGGGAGIEEEGPSKEKKRTKSFDISTRPVPRKPTPMKPEAMKPEARKKGK
ncbi:MAG: hypothetical protein ACYTG7_24705 [Planctomycetota bacterium]|jgi:hypothetical protein